MRAFIQPSNSNARVDEILEEVNGYIGKDTGLMAQAIGGWTRLLHVRYGTAYAQEQGALELKGWKKKSDMEPWDATRIKNSSNVTILFREGVFACRTFDHELFWVGDSFLSKRGASF